MRMIKRDQISVTFRERVTIKESDGTTYDGWSEYERTVKGNVQPAGGRVMAEQYGDRIGYMLVMYTSRDIPIEESDGAWVYVDPNSEKPDYKVVSVRRWRHTVIELEKVDP